MGRSFVRRVIAFREMPIKRSMGILLPMRKKVQIGKIGRLRPSGFRKPKSRNFKNIQFLLSRFQSGHYLFGKTPTVSHVHFDKPGVKLGVLDFGTYTALLETGSFSGREWD